MGGGELLPRFVKVGGCKNACKLRWKVTVTTYNRQIEMESNRDESSKPTINTLPTNTQTSNQQNEKTHKRIRNQINKQTIEQANEHTKQT